MDFFSRKFPMRTIAVVLVSGACLLPVTVHSANLTSPPNIDLASSLEVTPRRLGSINEETGVHEYEDCGGTCMSADVKARVDRMRGSFSMINPENLRDPDSPRLREGKEYLLLWYLFGILYMFAGLAIVCDEFFVPALEAFVDEFGISMDVAGATFMAAGGSMPELFTSFISTFQGSKVGFATIVGSAVFNVLFVIAVCALASTEVLKLTWWPLARDCTFYLIALFTVVLVFKGVTENQIELWEAFLLLAEYLAYCTFMKFNGKVQDWVNANIVDKYFKSSSGEVESPEEQQSKRASVQLVDPEVNANFTKPSTFRKGIVQLLTQNAYLYETAGIAAVTQIKGDLESTFRKLDKNGDGIINTAEIKDLLEQMGCKQNNAAITTALRRITSGGDDQVDFEAFKKWYIASEARIQIEVRRVFDMFDHNGNGTIETEEVNALLKSLGHKPTTDELNELMQELVAIDTNAKGEGEEGKGESGEDAAAGTGGTAGGADASALRQGGEPSDTGEAAANVATAETAANVAKKTVMNDDGMHATFEQFEEWYMSSMFYKKKQHKHELEDEEGDGSLSLDLPEDASPTAIAWYVFTYPLCAVLWCCLPDVRREKWSHNWKIAVLEFALSLFWIGVFSNYLYECIVVCSNTLSIPPEVSAVTVLAGGTSIPDLLSSYIVARNGEGDMAVSSSIGSNIFDVTVGLPLPWICFSLYNGGEPVAVVSDSLGFSVLVLIGMLVAVLGTIIACKWHLTKTLGWVMLVFYILFVAQDLLGQLPQGDPIWPKTF
eukprot:gnl/TRDRNA2_/TRDRNA2_175012_c0_seq3.p1 gnl/TRDRNA2_/TRDRNA2_175012_c0~~gnl/TRDRNA2_/TRDRNA2_175012_c0_seq3.p1  ORF type:complete len:777 (-),score=152.28 gnl/TRDRNA2_/TRDRNA2_175012_c0_seq3:930-3260(-)